MKSFQAKIIPRKNTVLQNFNFLSRTSEMISVYRLMYKFGFDQFMDDWPEM